MPRSDGAAIDMRFFDQPGYPELFEAWSDVFSQETTGSYVLDPTDALARTIDTRRQVQARFGYDTETLTTLERIACHNARMWQAESDQLLMEGAL